MYDAFEKFMMGILSLLFVMLLFLIIGVPILSYYRAIHVSEVWNRCHPNTQITVKEAWFTRPDIIICEKDQIDEL
jgi:hypothetical protein